MVSGSSSSLPAKLWMRSRRRTSRSFSGACRRVATTARQAGIVAAILGRTRVSIGMPCSSAMR
jgi:hypothetical protein